MNVFYFDELHENVWSFEKIQFKRIKNNLVLC